MLSDQLIIRRQLDFESRLSPFAARSGTATRKVAEPSDHLRTAYQVDRDRILQTKAFRRLTHKTQVFVAPLGDHYVTRLTHTLEVARIARTIARALNLNEDLTEAASLGHDIGHGPFGHAGEEALAECLPEGFRHNLHSVRVLEQLENGGRGLNLTADTLDAIGKSSKAREDIFAEGWGVPATLEGQIVKTADAIAYLNHDIGDAIRAGLLTEDDLPDSTRRELGTTNSERLATLVEEVVSASAEASGPGPNDVVTTSISPTIRLGRSVGAAANELRDFMFERVYLYESTLREAERGKRIVLFLFRHFLARPADISSDFALPQDPAPRRAADFVSGMTDRFAIRVARALGCPEARDWRVGG
ncbi:MAG: deoxyguanosinetriphosphate triphosphohydrolase [Dehalococcoidia bacterium]